MRGLLAVIVVGCDGRPAGAVRQTLGCCTLLERAVQQLAEVHPVRVLVSVPEPGLVDLARASGGDGLLRPPAWDSLESALEHALSAEPATASHLLAFDPLIPLRRPGRLAQAVTLARQQAADCVFSCHRESALIWHRSAMGLVPCFDPACPPDPADPATDLPWLREDGGFYLLSVATFLRTGHRHGGRLVPLETEPEEAVAATSPTGLAVCRALIAERARMAAAG